MTNKSTQLPPLEDITKPNLTTREAGFYLDRSAPSLRAMHWRGKAPVKPLRIGGRLAWPVSDIRRVVAGVSL